LSNGREHVIELRAEPDAKPAGQHSGLYHVALNYESRLDLARTLRRIAATRTSIQGASNHGTHEAIYLADPDGNGLELAWDFPRDQWPKPQELVRRGPRPLDVEGLLLLASTDATEGGAPARVGHVHLHVGDVRLAVAFYEGLVGFDLQLDLGSGAFMSAGGYHHHLAVNVWQGANAAPAPVDAVGLREWRIYLPESADVAATRARLVASGAPIHSHGNVDFVTADPWGIPLRVAVDPNSR
ncbi:MAG TPA: VOC family protein, partial [Candidatus Synoicihabitans sp.]|nr:VOC family protein [Candidatus Synoicihabitans sp.]